MSSLGTDKRPVTAHVPGPGSYDPFKTHKKTPPAWKIGQSTRDFPNKASSGSPGPGAYEFPEKIVSFRKISKF